MEQPQNTQFEDLAGVLSTWLFHAIFGFFNISIFIAVAIKYGAFVIFASIDNSYYSVLFSLSLFSLFCQFLFVLNKISVQLFLDHKDNDYRLFAGFYGRFSYSYFIVLFLIDKDYITSIVDILVISTILVLNSSFSVAHELAGNRKEEVFSSGSIHFHDQLLKIYQYLLVSNVANVFTLCLIVWIFWPLESLFLFLLSYKYMQSLVYGLVHWNELKRLLQYGPDSDTDIFCEEPRTKYVLHIIEVLLDGFYVLMIVANKGISVSNFCVTAYIGVCAASFTSKAWKLYREMNERRKIRKKIRTMYFAINEPS